MFVAIVQIPMTKRPRDAAVAAARKSAPTYAALGAKGLLRKYYLNGEAGGGGVYLWESEAARARLVHAGLGEAHGGGVRRQARGDVLRQPRRGRQ
jgi:hypothetical protein